MVSIKLRPVILMYCLVIEGQINEYLVCAFGKLNLLGQANKL